MKKLGVAKYSIEKIDAIVLPLTKELGEHVAASSILCACDWSEDMATAAMQVVETIYNTRREQLPQSTWGNTEEFLKANPTYGEDEE